MTEDHEYFPTDYDNKFDEDRAFIQEFLTSATGKSIEELRQDLDRPKAYVIRPDKLAAMLKCYEYLRSVFEPQGAKVEVLYGNSHIGAINIKGVGLDITDTAAFSCVFDHAYAFDTSAFLDGTVGFSFSFDVATFVGYNQD